MARPEFGPPTGKNLLDKESREKLPELYSGEEQGLSSLMGAVFTTVMKSGRLCRRQLIRRKA
jgi:hypothetical protein